MEEIIKVAIEVAPYIIGAVSTCVALFTGLSKRKTKKQLTRTEQECDLRSYMIQECKKAQNAVKYLRKDIPKEDISKYKHNIVLEKLTMYAKGCGYEWYSDLEWSDRLTAYITETKEVQA